MAGAGRDTWDTVHNSFPNNGRKPAKGARVRRRPSIRSSAAAEGEPLPARRPPATRRRPPASSLQRRQLLAALVFLD